MSTRPIAIDGGKRFGPPAKEAVERGGGKVVPIQDAEGLIFLHAYKPERLTEVLAQSPKLEWVQLPFAGIEPYVHLLDEKYRWTCGKGIYAPPVAEMTLGLLLAGFRNLNIYTRAKSWEPPIGRNLIGAKILILGGGGICIELIKLLAPFECDITVVRKHKTPLDFSAQLGSGFEELVPARYRSDALIKTADKLEDELEKADAVVLALSLTAETEGIIDAEKLGLMQHHSWLVNVARGKHIKTDDLVSALQSGAIGGAGLDVTDPEPLPDKHPLWNLENCIITPHTANTPEMAVELLSARVEENTKRFIEGNPLLGPVNPKLGY